MKIFSLLFFVVFGFFSLAAQERFVAPVDEAKKDASFLAFRTKLIEAAKKRDAKYVLSVVDPNIKNSFGGNDGIAEFKKFWKLESPTSSFWSEFIPVINNGGSFTEVEYGQIFFAPYLFNAFPADLDSFEYDAIFGNNVNLRERGDAKAKVIEQLSYNIVKADFKNSIKKPNTENEYEWVKIETLGGKTGFVSRDFVRSPIDLRAGFEKKIGKRSKDFPTASKITSNIVPIIRWRFWICFVMK